MRKKGFTILELLVVIAIIGVIFISLRPMINRTREQARRLECADNLRKIAKAIHNYASEHEGRFPLNLSDLYPNYIDNIKYFRCPSDIDSSEISQNGLDIDTATSYVYAGGWGIKDPLDVILISDKNYILEKDTNHAAQGGNVMHLDGDVHWMDIRDWVNPVDKH